MKNLFLFFFLVMTTAAFGQYDPTTAGRIAVSPSYTFPFNNTPAPSGINYGCLSNLNNCSWAYFAKCDSNSLILNFLFNANLDTLSMIVYGPFQDTVNLSSKLANSTPFLCYSYMNNNPFNSFVFSGAPKGIYYLMLNSRTSQSNARMYFTYLPGNSLDPGMCRICEGVANLQAKICTIDLDSATQRNRLIWDETDTANVSGYVVYRENSILNLFDSIGFVPLSAFNEYIDMTANPAIRPWRYRIYKIDNCGQSPDSADIISNNWHYRTLHLQLAVSGINSVNLIWNSNSILGEGSWLPTYHIYRGSSPSSLSILDSIPYQVNQYTDPNPLPGPNYYQVERRKITDCYPSIVASYSKGGSNIIGTIFTGIANILPETTFSIFPNPVSDRFTLQLHSSAQMQENEFHLFAGDGKWIGSYATVELLQKAGESLVSGVYTIQLINAKGTSNKRFVKL